MAKSSCRSQRLSSETGFSLVEVLVSTVVLTVGLVAMAELLAISTKMHADASEASRSTQYAQAKIDELVKLNMGTAPQVQINAADTLAANTANYFDTPMAGVTRRWRVQAGPVANTRLLTVRVISRRARQFGTSVDISTILRQW
jgi:Tfp pilus assembly protein PilV